MFEEFRRGGGCWDARAKLIVYDTRTVMKVVEAKDVKKNDLVMTPSGFVKVICVAKTFTVNGNIRMRQLPNGLLITPFHPVYIDGSYRFPMNVEGAIDTTVICDFVLDLVLEREHSVFVNGIVCATLGHQKRGDVIEHDYWGNTVIHEMKAAQGWQVGLVTMNDLPGVQQRMQGAALQARIDDGVIVE